jgi:hypothetical protein
MKRIIGSIAVGLMALAGPRPLLGTETPLTQLPEGAALKDTGGEDRLSFSKIAYHARVSDSEARVMASIRVESSLEKETSETLLEGELALLPTKLPASLHIERTGNVYKLFVLKRGRYEFEVDFMAKVTQQEPWNQVSFTGPRAAIASAEVVASGSDLDIKLLSGTQVSTTHSNGLSQVTGILGGERTFAFRWSKTGRVGEIARQAVLTAETTARVEVTPTVIKYLTRVNYGILQGRTGKLVLSLPNSQTLTKLVGEQIRDWELKPSPGFQVLEVQLIRPLEHEFELTLYSEQSVESKPVVQLELPQPLEVEREAGSFTIGTEDTGADVLASEGLRQVNTVEGALAAYRFNSRPFKLELKLKRIEPEITVAQRIHARLEETRLTANYWLGLAIEKAGIYSLELTFPEGFNVTQIQGKTLEDWKLTGGHRGSQENPFGLQEPRFGGTAVASCLGKAVEGFSRGSIAAAGAGDWSG